jgi:DNA-binding CsgD family transcriptional regulator
MPAYTPLRGRRSECETLDRLLESARAGNSQALVVRGEPGVGKTALLEYAIESAPDFRVARSVGVESEMQLAFAGLQQLCASMLDRFDHLPEPQRDALGTAFGLRAGGPPDRFLVGLAALSLMSDVADQQPLLCVVDDSHWLDRESAQTLAFVARRLLAESIGLVFAARTPNEELAHLPQLGVDGLSDKDSRALLESVIAAPLDARVRDRIVAEVHGNPLALLELPRGLAPADLAGGFGLPDAAAVPVRIEESFRRRFEPLPPDSRQLLLVAAAEPVGEPALVWRAAELLGIEREAADPATSERLIEFGARVRFRHPLVRSAVYQAASPAERRSVHAALADATDPEADPDRRAWHRAHAAAGPDDDVAAELERSADRAQARGGLAAAAAFLERAAALTLDPKPRTERALAAAQAKLTAGAPEAAGRLLAAAEAGRLDDLQRARVDLLRARIAFVENRGSDAPPLLLRAAHQFERLDEALARDTYLEAFTAVIFAGRLVAGDMRDASEGMREAARAIRARFRPADPPRPPDLLLDGLTLAFTEGYAAGAPVLRRGLSAFRKEEVSIQDAVRWLWLATHAAATMWDDESWYQIVEHLIRVTREAGALSILPIALATHNALHLFAGEFAAAASNVDDLEALSETSATEMTMVSALQLAAWRGQKGEVDELARALLEQSAQRGTGMAIGTVAWSRSVLYNGLGRYEDAVAAAVPSLEYLHDAFWVLPELVEAANRSGDVERANAALEELAAMTTAAGNAWGLGIEARCRALLTDGDAAEVLYRNAIDALARTRIRVELARSHLLYGEWLRRERRRREAREQLRTAHGMLDSIGARAFAERAARELQATGETARSRTWETRDELTPREAQIARLARDGLSNADIGAQLFISPKTVQYHLHKVFAKLGISSRTELELALPDESASSSGSS